MATTPRQQIASPQSFTSDPLEQVFAKQFSDPNSVVGALSLVNMQTAGAARDRGQQQYLDNLHMTNALAAQMAQRDMDTDLLKTSLEKGPDYLKAGADPSDVPMIGRLFTGPSGNLAAGLQRAHLQAQVNELNAKAAASGREGAPKFELQTVNDANGNPVTTITTKGSDPNAVARIQEQGTTRVTQGRGDPTMPGNPNAPYASRTLGSVSAESQAAWQRAHPGQAYPTTTPFANQR